MSKYNQEIDLCKALRDMLIVYFGDQSVMTQDCKTVFDAMRSMKTHIAELEYLVEAQKASNLKLCAALNEKETKTKQAEPTTQWVMTAPDGTTFAGDTPLRAANQASKYRLEIDPVAAKKFLDAIETIRKEGEEEHDRCMKEYGTLNCPACGGSGHIGDVTDGDTLAAAKGGAL